MFRYLGLGALVLALSFVPSLAQAQYGNYNRGQNGNYNGGYNGNYNGGYNGGYGQQQNHGHNHGSGPVYHGPSVHYDRVYHPTGIGFSLFRGIYTTGHYDAVPHYVPGHVDYRHGNHIHGNPRYHGR